MITRELSRMDQPTCTVCAHAHALAKTNEVAFVRLMMRLLLALLKVDVVFTHCAHSARADFHTEAESEQKAIPTVGALGSPAVDSGSACVCQESSGKASAARTSSVAAPVAF